MQMPTRKELIQKGYKAVGFVGEAEWLAKESEDQDILYHVILNDNSIYKYPQCVDREGLKGMLLLSNFFNNNFVKK